MKKKDAIKEYQKQCVDQRVCLFYVADRLKDICDMNDGKKAHKALWEFKEECVHNIGINALIERYEY
jgi:hypothetical protein